MNRLIASSIKMTSLDISGITGKMHKHVMADVRKEIKDLGEEIGRTIFRLTERLDSQNRKQPIFEFGKDGAMQLALKYDAKTRYKVIKRIEELESAGTVNYTLPSNFKEALIMLAETVDENDHLKAEIEGNKEKVLLANAYPKVNRSGTNENSLSPLLRFGRGVENKSSSGSYGQRFNVFYQSLLISRSTNSIHGNVNAL